MILILIASLGSLLPEPSPADLMDGGAISGWTIPYMLGWDTRITRDGLPLLVLDQEPSPGWGSYDRADLLTPIEAGVWAGGGWQLDLTSGSIPDSSYESVIGLLENTAGMSRYSACIRRPLPLGLGVDLSMDREDTLTNQRILLLRNDVSFGLRAWQDDDRATVIWTAWSPGAFTARASFGRLTQGDRRWELIGSLNAVAGDLAVQAGAAGSLHDDTVLSGEGHLRLQMPVAGMTAVARADVEDTDGDVDIGGTAGLITSLGPAILQAGMVAPPGTDPSFIATVSAWLATVYMTAGNGTSGGLQVLVPHPSLTCRAGLGIGGDSLVFMGEAMPSIRWGGAGRISAGGSWELTHLRGPGTTVGTIHVKSLFIVDRFAFVFSVEDVLDDWRSYTFGIFWSFTDHPPRPPEEEGSE